MSNKKMFIFLHGYNSCGAAMKVVDSAFRKMSVAGSVFLYPDAPFKVNNSDNYCWFQFVFGNDHLTINEDFIFRSMEQAMPYLASFIKKSLETNYGFSYSDVILVGFSQGAGLAIHASMRLPEPICGVISFSGGLANPNNEILNSNINKSPILLIHGMDDPILPYQLSSRNEQALKKAGFHVECHLLKNTKHLISLEAIDIAGNFIKNYLIK